MNNLKSNIGTAGGPTGVDRSEECCNSRVPLSVGQLQARVMPVPGRARIYIVLRTPEGQACPPRGRPALPYTHRTKKKTFSLYSYMYFSSFAPYGITGPPSPPGGKHGLHVYIFIYIHTAVPPREFTSRCTRLQNSSSSQVYDVHKIQSPPCQDGECF